MREHRANLAKPAGRSTARRPKSAALTRRTSIAEAELP
jgi:hypothetical protein